MSRLRFDGLQSHRTEIEVQPKVRRLSVEDTTPLPSITVAVLGTRRPATWPVAPGPSRTHITDQVPFPRPGR